jgi:capsular exopolysaccharide synthesis family protein
LKELNARVTTAKGERLKLETDLAQWQKLQGGSPEELLALPSISGSEEVAAVRRKISDKETEIAALSGRYKSEHPKYIQAAGEVAELRSSLIQAIGKAGGRLSASVEAARTVETKLEEALQSQEQLALELSQTAIPYQSLEREVVADRALYDALLARLKESEVGQAISPQTVRVVAPALLPGNPSKPNKRLILLLSVFAGGAIALSVVLVLHLMDGSLTTVDQAERALGLRSLAAVPLRPKTKLAQTGRLLIDRPNTAVAEAFRGLRTALHFAAGPTGCRTVLITSAVPGEGKSFCAINYAVALAQQGFSTLLIDLDLRLPSIGAVFLGREKAVGATELLRGTCSLAEAVHATTIPNLSILPAGGRAPNPAELIGQGTCAALLQQALTKFERIVIDTAPVHAVAETLLLAPEADAVCLVVRAASTQGSAAARAVEILRQTGAKLPGFVLNGLPMNNGGYYYHYHAPGYGNDEVYGGSGLASRA